MSQSKLNQAPTRPSKEQPEQKSREIASAAKPVLRFSPTAWAKLLFFRDRGPTEIGGFGVSAADDLLYVEDFVTVEQDVSVTSVAFEDESVADLFEAQVDAGRKPEQFARIWLHTHPGGSAEPSATDEETFHRVFGRCEWALLFVLAKGGKTFARLRFNVGPGGHVMIPVQVEYGLAFSASDHEAWEAEYQANIKPEVGCGAVTCFGYAGYESVMAGYCTPEDLLGELEALDPDERQYILNELAGHQDLWKEGEQDGQ